MFWISSRACSTETMVSPSAKRTPFGKIVKSDVLISSRLLVAGLRNIRTMPTPPRALPSVKRYNPDGRGLACPARSWAACSGVARWYLAPGMPLTLVSHSGQVG